VGNVKSCRIVYERQDDQGKTFEYEERIDQEKFATYRDGELYAFYTDAGGNPVAEWDNEYGFVPLVITRHKDTGYLWGANAFQTQITKIDELNDGASYLNDQVRKTVNTLWAFIGVKGKSAVTVQSDDKASVPALYLPDGTDVKPLVAPLDLTAALENVKAMQLELERDLPELALHRLREGGNLTAPGVRAGYTDAIDRIVEARGNYDGGLVRAHMMALTIGGIGKYANFESFGREDYAKGNLEHYIGERPVIEDTLSQADKITALQSIKDMPPALARLALQEMGYSAAVIEEVVKEMQTTQEAQTRAAVRGLADSVFGPSDENQDAESEDDNGDEIDPEATVPEEA
jgi:hypothetical protein